MYDEELTSNNKIFYKNEINDLDTNDENQKILNDIFEKISTSSSENTKTEEEKKNANNLKSYKNKLKNFYSVADDDVKDFVISTMQNFKKFDENNYREFLTANSISLKSVKNQTALMKKFCDASAIYETSSQKNNIYNANQVKEVILVIPKKNGIDVSEETNSFLLKTAIEFYKENHPHNEILIAFSHSDETTNHCHLFLNLRNSKTNKFDFVEQETELAEKNQAISLRKKPKIEDFKTEKRKDSTAKKLLLNETQKWRGETLQRLFYQHFNKSAKEQAMNFEAVFNVKDSTNEDAYKFMNEQSKLPKEKRKLNMLHLQTETIQKKIEVSKAVLSEESEKMTKVIESRKSNEIVIENQKDIHSKKKKELSVLMLEIERYNKEKEKNRTEAIRFEEDLKKLKQEEATHKESIKRFTQEYFTKIFDEMKMLYQQVLGLKPLFERNLKKSGLGKIFLKNDALDEDEFDNRVKDIVRDKSVASLELFNSIDRHYDKKDKDFEARTKKWTHKEVKHRAENNRTSKNEWTEYLDRSAPSSKVENENSHKLKNT
ncbi:MAG: hypothetical protein ACTIOG_02625 [Pseudomonas helleri]|uniref:hypothetical protein n=1 Tax=Pseudomonas helleri TaxID=1608996 RepID=UPI003FD015F9